MKNKIIISIICLVLLVATAIAVVACTFPNNNETTKPNNNIQAPGDDEREPIDYTNSLLLIDAIFSNYSIFDIDYEKTMLAAIRGYVDATGDKYAMYYTPEELEDLYSENNGDLYGIGVQVIFDYEEYFMEIVLIMPDSPAQGKLEVGDKVTHIILDGERISLSSIVEDYKQKYVTIYPSYTEEEINNAACYDTFQYAVSKLKGAEGTYTEFVIDRDGVSMDMKIQRAKVKTVSVTGKVSIKDKTVGIVSISQFDLTTPTQFKECMNTLIASGCNKFVFDVRNNPGGDLASVVAVLSTILQKGQVILSTKDSSNQVEITKVKAVNYGSTSDYVTCNVTESEIGMYSKYKMVVLANENSASAAELFTAAMRDHNVAKVVGVKTYGKGSVQSIIPLSYYGDKYYGAIKLTTKLYFPPCGEGYDGGIGIAPHYAVELEGIAAETHFYKLTEEIDNQLQKAVSVLVD